MHLFFLLFSCGLVTKGVLADADTIYRALQSLYDESKKEEEPRTYIRGSDSAQLGQRNELPNKSKGSVTQVHSLYSQNSDKSDVRDDKDENPSLIKPIDSDMVGINLKKLTENYADTGVVKVDYTPPSQRSDPSMPLTYNLGTFTLQYTVLPEEDGYNRDDEASSSLESNEEVLAALQKALSSGANKKIPLVKLNEPESSSESKSDELVLHVIPVTLNGGDSSEGRSELSSLNLQALDSSNRAIKDNLGIKGLLAKKSKSNRLSGDYTALKLQQILKRLSKN